MKYLIKTLDILAYCCEKLANLFGVLADFVDPFPQFKKRKKNDK